MTTKPPSRRRVEDALRIHIDAQSQMQIAGTERAIADEQHRVALMHPEYDGFLVLSVTAKTDLADLRVNPDEALAEFITPQHLTGALYTGQERAIDLELHPRTIPAEGVSGLLHIVDENGAACAPAVRVTLATDPALVCVLAGVNDGPWRDEGELTSAVDELLSGMGDAARLAHRIERVAAGRPDPGWKKRPFWRRSS